MPRPCLIPGKKGAEEAESLLYLLSVAPSPICLPSRDLTPRPSFQANSLTFLSNALPEVPYSRAVGGP